MPPSSASSSRNSPCSWYHFVVLLLITSQYWTLFHKDRLTSSWLAYPSREQASSTAPLQDYYDVCIAGAGLSGSVLAERYASQLNYTVLVVEKRDHIGGNCYDYIDPETGIRISQYGAHLFHTYYEDVWSYVQKWGPWAPYEHKVRGLVNNKIVPIPVNIETVNALFDQNISSAQEMDQWLANEQIPSDNPQNSEQVALSRVGPRLYNLIFKPYTFKQWNKYPVELGPEVLKRIPVRNNWDERYFSDPRQALPTNGYTSLFFNMLASPRITVRTNTDYFEVRKQVQCGKHYFTGPIDAYFENHNLPKLEYRSLEFERKVEKNVHFFQPNFVVNHPQDTVDFTRIVEYKHLYNQSHLADTVYFIERSKDGGEPYYPVPNKRNKDLYAQYQQFAETEERTKNVSFVGRLANYKYFNMDQAIKNALDLFETNTGISYLPQASPTESSAETSAEVVDANIKLLPDWRMATDCSVYDPNCVMHKQRSGRYMDYPFPYGRSEQKHEQMYTYEQLSLVPEEWKQELLSGALLVDQPARRTVEYDYPPTASDEDRKRCMDIAETETWMDQLHRLLSSRLQRESDTGMIAFSVMDIAYAFDMLHDIFEMNGKVVGFQNSFFLVALDHETLSMACQYNYPVLAWPSSKLGASKALREDVTHAKFEVVSAILARDIPVFFYESDLWFVRSPKSIIKNYHQEKSGDILLSSHQNHPAAPNIGVYTVSANERTKEYFQLCIQMANESPNTHDQWIMHQLIDLADSVKHHQNITFGARWNPPPVTPRMNHPPSHGFYSPHEVVADERPFPSQMTVAIHPLAAGPLKSPYGKKMIAKELGAWYGFTGPKGDGGYYRRAGERRRYLTMDGHILNGYSMNMNWEFDGWESEIYHEEVALHWTIATLLALARRTGRIFIMPRIVFDHGVHFLWTLLDFQSVEALGIDVRETSFLSNPKAWQRDNTPFQKVARTALGSIVDTGKDNTMFAQYPSRSGESETVKAWKLDQMDEGQALDAWWALHTAIPEVDSSELLLVNPHYINRLYANRMDRKIQSAALGLAEKEIADIYSRLRWCTGKSHESIQLDRVAARSSSEYSCYGKGETRPFKASA